MSRRNLRTFFATLTSVAMIATLAINWQSSESQQSPQLAENVSAQQQPGATIELFNQLPLRFERNDGQFDQSIEFVVRTGAMAMAISATEAQLRLTGKTSADGEAEIANLQLEFVGAESNGRIAGDTPLTGRSNYFRGSDPHAWQTNVPAFKRVEIEQIYPGIDLVYHGDNQALEYDFRLAPGASPDQIALRFTGVDTVQITADGELALETPAGTILQRRPFAYQQVAGKQLPVEADYLLADNGDIHFQLAAYDTNSQLIIDPVLVYSTFYGGAQDDKGMAIAVDDQGAAYIAGTTLSLDFPLQSPQQSTLQGSMDAFVLKLSADGQIVEYATYIGGGGADGEPGDPDDDDIDTGKAIAVTATGELVMTGATSSAVDFPLVNALQPSYGGGDSDGYLLKLAADGQSLLFSTYLGGTELDKVFGLALDSSEQLLLTGVTKSTNFPTLNALQPARAGGRDAFVSKISADGSALIWSTYLGGTIRDKGLSIAVDLADKVYVSGLTKSTNFPLFNALQTNLGGGKDGFVTKLTSDGQTVEFSTYLGGTDLDKAKNIAIASDGSVVVAGFTGSVDFPTTAALQPLLAGGKDGFLTRLDASGALICSTYLGGSGNDRALALTVTSDDIAHLTGFTKSDDFPLIDALQLSRGGKKDIFVASLTNCDQLNFSTYLGGALLDRGKAIATDPAGNLYLTGFTKSATSFPLLNAVQGHHGGEKDAFVIRLGNASLNLPPTITSTPATSVDIGVEYSYNVDANDPDGDSLIYRLVTSPTGMVIDELTGEILWAPPSTGDYPVEVEVDDSRGGLDNQSWIITVIQPNRAPVITSTPITTGTFGLPYSYDVNASDADADTLSYSLTASPLGMVIDSLTGVISWIPDAGGDVTVVVQVSDGNGGTASQTYTLNIVIPNQLPEITSSPVLSAEVDAAYSYPVTATDADNDPLTFTLTDAPLGMTINPTTGQINWTPASSGSFSATVTVSDGIGEDNQSFAINVEFAPGVTPPGLDPIGDQVVILGTKLELQLTATDADGDALPFAIAPAPLPEGMSLNAASGELVFKPLTAASYEITVIATDGRFTAEETLTITVPPAIPGAATSFSGRVVDANAMAAGDDLPIVGATISFMNTGVSDITDANGHFTLIDVPDVETVLNIDNSTANPAPDGSGYASFREGLPLVQNVLTIEERPFSLPRNAPESITQVIPSQTTTVNNPTLDVTLVVPPNTAFNEDATPFTGDLSISLVPAGFEPAALPPFLDPAMLITIQPAGTVFATPVPITFPNLDNLTPGSEVNIWSVNPDTGRFHIVGTGEVTADGTEIVTISGGITRADWHATLPPQATANPNAPPKQDPNKPCKKCASEKANSTFSLVDGHVGERFSLPAYRSLEASRTLSFSYRTFRAHPRPEIEFDGQIPVRSTIPDLISYQIQVGGIDQGDETFLLPTDFSESVDEPFRLIATFDASAFSSGMVDYDLKVTSNFAGGTRVSAIDSGTVMVVNEQASPFGAGWMLDGLYRLAFNTDASVTLISPDGGSINYRPDAPPNTFINPDSDYAVFIRNPNGSYTHTEKNGTVMQFDTDGLITAHLDRNNNTTGYAYDLQHKLITITDPVGLETNFIYNGFDLLESVTDPAGRQSNFSYDAHRNLTGITFPDGTFEIFEYDQRHLLVAHEDERQNRSVYRYDAMARAIDVTLPDNTVRAAIGKASVGLVDPDSGLGSAATPAPVTRPDKVMGQYLDGRGHSSTTELDAHNRTTLAIDQVGRITQHVRDADSNATQTTRPNGSEIDRIFDAFGNVLTQTEQFNGAVTNYLYDQYSLVTSVTNPNQHTTTINRDPLGNPTSTVNHLGHTTSMVYDSQGLVTQRTSPNGLVSDYGYNSLGLVESLTETPPIGSPGNVRVTQYSYYPTGLIQTLITPDGITLSYEYDERSRVTSITDNLNQVMSYTYDEHGNVIETQTRSSDDSLALQVSSVFDSRNRLIETHAPHLSGESITQRILDNNSNLIELIDPNGNSSFNGYDESNRLTDNTHRLSGITQYQYDPLDRITKVTAPNGVITRYSYDVLGRRTSETSADRGNLDYEYDLANNLISVTEGRGITATLTYDELERVETKTYPNSLDATTPGGKIEDVTYSYDSCAFGLGYLCSRTDESGSVDFEYDGFGNQTQMIKTELAVAYTTSYQYDDGDHLSLMTLPSGRIIDYQRDGVRRVSAINTTLNGLPQTIVSGIIYRGDNQMTQCTFGNGLIDDRTYDLQGRLTAQTLQTPASFVLDQRTYSHDANSNILAIQTNFEDNGYQYDDLDRIIDDSIDSDTPIQFQYDLNDNRLNKDLTDLSATQSYTYQLDSNKIEQLEVFQSGATPLDPLPNRDLVYSDTGRLFQLFEAGIKTAEYIYNDQGQRTRKTLYQADGFTIDSITLFHYDQMGYLVTETTETGALLKDYIWQEGMHPIAQIDNDTTETITYLHTDHLMTARLATDDLQTIAWRWEGEAFGETPADEISGISVNLRFPGQYFDGESSLHYNWNRYYDSSLGRYMTSDPIGLGGGQNTYSYSNLNPLKLIDPAGKAVISSSSQGATCAVLKFLTYLFCKGNTACTASDTCSELSEKVKDKVSCIDYQRLYSSLCFSDDQTHFQRIENELNGIRRCLKKWSEKGCGQCR